MQHIMINTLTLYEVFAYFFLYSFLGWVSEVAFHAITAGKFVNRGFLNGPVCPIYGTGVVAILLILGKWIDTPWLVLLIGIALPTLIELITGWALETFFHNKWWDYSARKFNVKGYICLEFSLLWGIAVLAVTEVVHPAVTWFAGLFGEITGTVLVALCAAAMIADLTVTVLQVFKLNRKLSELDEVAKKMRVGSEFIGEKIANATLKAEAGVKAVKETLTEKRERALDAVTEKMPARLLKAFPHLQSRKNPDSVALANESLD
ncbi:MAG: putative ABC transporter permease, partial [Clostridia bacterium]|nr:putative ABC transporter permease [Clostridia bacterium]